jgi:LmbE family N-acetylglucosaminyl deacetylase
MTRLTPDAAWAAVAAAVSNRTAQPLVVSAVVAHPDDEVISAGILLRRLMRRGGTVDLVHVTDGAPRDGRDAQQQGFATREAYARARRAELQRALATLELEPREQIALDVIDQEASLQIGALAGRLAGVFGSLRPNVILTHPFEGGHPDHDATACAVHTAVARVALDPRPLLVEFTSYHRGPEGMRVGSFLPGTGVEPETLLLTEDERVLKGRSLECFASQAAIVAWFPLDAERFRRAPRYDFLRAPYEGRPLYEDFDWGMDQQRWRELARRGQA